MKTVIEKFNAFLGKKNLQFEGVIIGGAALNIMGITSRVTKDVDCLFPNIPEEILSASEDFIKNQLKDHSDYLEKQ